MHCEGSGTRARNTRSLIDSIVAKKWIKSFPFNKMAVAQNVLFQQKIWFDYNKHLLEFIASFQWDKIKLNRTGEERATNFKGITCHSHYKFRIKIQCTNEYFRQKITQILSYRWNIFFLFAAKQWIKKIICTKTNVKLPIEQKTWIEIMFTACLTAIQFSVVCFESSFGSLNVTVKRETKKKTKQIQLVLACACVFI